ncbi:4703_t:CDS:2 [Funneliformis mosseae]|uniref:4703_t:CDS:1 n=1 Tax=Funneliformis mosseae TaxID=27381 RepID=A0A9N8ZLP7_FUNMO|nr:4703_t:CDS:2 [Funneliformis mosseae]
MTTTEIWGFSSAFYNKQRSTNSLRPLTSLSLTNYVQQTASFMGRRIARKYAWNWCGRGIEQQGTRQGTSLDVKNDKHYNIV